MKIVQELNKRPKIKGVTGFGHWSFIEQNIGKKDGAANQLCVSEDSVTTPWVEEKYDCYRSYINETCLKVTRELEKVYSEVYARYADLELMEKDDGGLGELTGEEGQRIQAAHEARIIANKKRKEEILIRLAEIKADISTVDEALDHNLERAKYTLKSHVGFYWKGILKVSPEPVPVYPHVKQKEIRGRKTYEEHTAAINTVLNNALQREMEV